MGITRHGCARRDPDGISRHDGNQNRIVSAAAFDYKAGHVKRALQLLLLFGAVIGLFGQQAAYAASARATMAPAAVSQMNADCMEMMQKPQPQPAQKPCKGLTLDCIAAMGCVVPIVFKEPAAPTTAPQFVSALAFWPATSVLVGNDLPPEQHPPTTLS